MTQQTATMLTDLFNRLGLTLGEGMSHLADFYRWKALVHIINTPLVIITAVWLARRAFSSWNDGDDAKVAAGWFYAIAAMLFVLVSVFRIDALPTCIGALIDPTGYAIHHAIDEIGGTK